MLYYTYSLTFVTLHEIHYKGLISLSRDNTKCDMKYILCTSSYYAHILLLHNVQRSREFINIHPHNTEAN